MASVLLSACRVSPFVTEQYNDRSFPGAPAMRKPWRGKRAQASECSERPVCFSPGHSTAAALSKKFYTNFTFDSQAIHLLTNLYQTRHSLNALDQFWKQKSFSLPPTLNVTRLGWFLIFKFFPCCRPWFSWRPVSPPSLWSFDLSWRKMSFTSSERKGRSKSLFLTCTFTVFHIKIETSLSKDHVSQTTSCLDLR